MTRKIIAVVKLAPGNIGWYDALTGIHLTLARSKANVYSGSNTTNLIKALRERVIELVNGSLIEGNQEPTINSTPLNTIVVDIKEDNKENNRENNREDNKSKTVKSISKTTTKKRASKKTK